MVLSRIKSYLVDRTLEIIPGVYRLTTRIANIVVIAEEELLARIRIDNLS